MEDFAGIIIFFLVIGLIDKLGKKSKKKSNDSTQPAAGRTADKKAARPAREVALPTQPVKKSAEGMGAPDLANAAEQSKTQVAKARAEAAEKLRAQIEKRRAEAAQAARPFKGASPKTPLEKLAENRPGTDKEGCVGGSIAHTQHEGEAKAEHAMHMKRTIQSAAQPSKPAVSIQQLRTEDLRKAVIMSEILDKPKALRR